LALAWIIEANKKTTNKPLLWQTLLPKQTKLGERRQSSRRKNKGGRDE